MITINQCPICESGDIKPFLTVKDHSISKEDFLITYCSNCGLKMTNPRPEDDKLPSYYESEDYVSHSDTNKGLINFLYQRVKSITLAQKEKLISSFKTEKDLLDIGCGTGDFILHCKEKGWTVSGLEPDQNARKRAHEKGLESVLDIDQLFQLKGPYSIITMWHVLEHVSTLNEYFIKLNELLNDNGRLLIAVPHPDSPDAKMYKDHWAAYDVPRHLFHFSKKNISDLATKHGFEVEKIQGMKFDSYYVSMLSEKYKGGSIISAALNGLKSNMKAKSDTTHSSLIYILRKKAK